MKIYDYYGLQINGSDWLSNRTCRVNYNVSRDVICCRSGYMQEEVFNLYYTDHRIRLFE